MPSFREMRKVRPIGFHCHHIIPVEVAQKRSLALIMAQARYAGFDIDDFTSNGMLLPSIERNAIAFSLPLHRGPHPHYNAYVADQIGRWNRLRPTEVRARLSHLQGGIAKLLRGNFNLVQSSDRTFLRPNADFRKIDHAIDALWADAGSKSCLG
jgi:hypothetical protein